MGETKTLPRFLICAPGSGSGKTLITCGLLRALLKKGFHPCAYKCGPDFIDPMFHRTVLGVPSRNLDLVMAGEEGVKATLTHGAEGADIGVIEGVMGFYDGLGLSEGIGSSYDLCVKTGTPAVLVVDAKGMSRSVLALIKGYLEYGDTLIGGKRAIRGVILNRVSAGLAGELSEMIRSELGIPVIGYLPVLGKAVLESRHLGLVMPSEIPEILSVIDMVSDELSKSLDMDALLEIAGSAEGISSREEDSDYGELRDVTVGVAKDEAFCFYYQDNLELLQKMGARIKFFSPIHDKRLPEVSRLIIGGGYPELYAKELSENKDMLIDIKKAASDGMPILAECGGFLYLQERLETAEGDVYNMAGVFRGNCYKKDKLSHFGYVEVSASKDNPYLVEGERVRGHEFHYYDTTDNGDVLNVQRLRGGKGWSGYQLSVNAFGGFAHLYYPSCSRMIERFLRI